MSIRHAVLGLLERQPSHGYGLVRRFRDQVGPGWQLNPSHIYGVLDQLEREGLIERVADRSAAPAVSGLGMRERGTTYRTTERGVETLDRWLVNGPVRVQPIREETYLRMAVCRPENIAELIEVLSLQERATYELLEQLAAACSLEEALRPPIDWGKVPSRMIAAGQIARAEADLAWLRRMRRTLEWLQTQELRGARAPHSLHQQNTAVR